MRLSARAKNAIKPALAVTIAYGISLGMGWQNSYWAGFAVAMISLSTAGQSLNKGAMRMLGTLVAATAALTLIAWFAQDRWWFIGLLSVYIGFCTYMIAGNEHQYFWYCCAFVCLVICDHAAGDLPNAFNIAISSRWVPTSRLSTTLRMNAATVRKIAAGTDATASSCFSSSEM